MTSRYASKIVSLRELSKNGIKVQIWMRKVFLHSMQLKNIEVITKKAWYFYQK